MLFRDQFDVRAAELYKSQYGLAGPVKDGKRIVRPRTPLPFNRDQFALWLWQQIGLQAKLCPYGCGVPIDILSCTVDHMIPRAQQGSFALDNLCLCCVHCNTLKGNMTAAGFRLLMAAGREMSQTDWAVLQKRIMIGNQAQMDRFRAIRAQRELKRVKGELPERIKPAELGFTGGFDPDF